MEPETRATDRQSLDIEKKPQLSGKYRPNKHRRAIRRQVYERFYWLRDAPSRLDAELDWETADKEYQMYIPDLDPDDWQSHLTLPDAFSAIQAQMQETIERKSRPHLIPTEESDEPISEFSNAVLEYNMNNTGYDYQYFMAKLSAAIRGTAFMMDYWRTDKRMVKDPDSVQNGKIAYKDREITDYDDDTCEWVPNEFIYIDEKAKHIDEADDGFKREILNVDVFGRIYGNRDDFFDTEYVLAGGDTGNRSFYKMPKDITEQDVEVLHYYHRGIDAYWVVANNVVIHDSPLPWKHKELPFAVVYQYRIPGQFWGMGIPKIIHMLSEERKSIRNLNMDRQKMQLNKMFLHNSSFDVDDEDLVTRPHGIISVDTNGQPLNQAIQPLEYGDVPASYFRTEEILLEDIRRAHGIDDRIQGVNVGGTATEAAILKESALKRVNLISLSNEMDTLVRIGRLKWSNIQFFYGVPRMEKIVQKNEERDKKVYRTVAVAGKKFSIVDNDGGKALSMEDIRGHSALALKPAFAKYLQGSYDISVDTEVYNPTSKAIAQTKATELFSLMLSNPATMAQMDIAGAMSDVLKTNEIKADKWLRDVVSAKDMQTLAEAENMVMSAGQPLAGTEGATEEHTLVHLGYAKSMEFEQLPPEGKALIMNHILQEHDANPATGDSASLLGEAGLAPGGGAPAGPPGMNSPFNPSSGTSPQTGQPQAQTADLQATNFANPE